MNPLPLFSLIARSGNTRQILSRIDTTASSSSSVLLIGETGVGKELFAEYIHRNSSRRQQPLVRLRPTCVEIPMVAHLGDVVVIDGNISITAVGPAITAQNSRRSHRSHSKGGMAQ